MQIHHGKHHQAYVTNLNAALEKHPTCRARASRICVAASTAFPKPFDRGTQQRRRSLEPQHVLDVDGAQRRRRATGKAADAINGAFGSFDAFKEQWAKAAPDVSAAAGCG
jgi:Fe-Mn family superoxide dismutase